MFNDDLTKQPANNVASLDEPQKPAEATSASEPVRTGLGGYTKRNFRPGQTSVGGAINPEAAPRRRFFKHRGKKICKFCARGTLKIDYKAKAELEKYINPYAKILPRRQTGTCALHQKHLGNAIKRARALALLPFVHD